MADNNQLEVVLLDNEVPLRQKIDTLRNYIADDQQSSKVAVRDALGNLIKKASESNTELTAQLKELLGILMMGPRRNARIITKPEGLQFGNQQVVVALEDGTCAYPVFAEPADSEKLSVGDCVMLDCKATAVLAAAPKQINRLGSSARFERRIDNDRIELKLEGDQGRTVFLVSDEMREALDDGKIKPGAHLLVSHKQGIALSAMPESEGFSHYRFLEKVPVPDVDADRDIGNPPKAINELAEIIRAELINPDMRRAYKLRRCVTKLLAGVSGSGKTLAIHAIWRKMYEIMAEVTGAEIGQLPHRVFWLRPSQMLSKWFGDSEKLIERAMDEVEALADEQYEAPNGKKYKLPVLVILEEIDGIARSRGDGDPIYGRVLTTLLQRLDPNSQKLKDKMIIFIGTTNEPGSVDRAFLRRIGGTVETFGVLDRTGFGLVLEKHLHDLPIYGVTDRKSMRKFIDGLCSWMFDTDMPGLELDFGDGKEVKKHCDFLTGGLIDRAVQQTSAEMAQKDSKEEAPTGIDMATLAKALDDQITTTIGQVTVHNVNRFVVTKDDKPVRAVRRMAQNHNRFDIFAG